MKFINILFQGLYCSEECQKEDWAEHKKECKKIQRKRKQRKEEKKKEERRKEDKRKEEMKKNEEADVECSSKMEELKITEVD